MKNILRVLLLTIICISSSCALTAQEAANPIDNFTYEHKVQFMVFAQLLERLDDELLTLEAQYEADKNNSELKDKVAQKEQEYAQAEEQFIQFLLVLQALTATEK